MALLYQATLTPTKIELLRAWVPTQEWSDGVDGSTLEAVGAYRFDDPAGEVGLETHILAAAGGRILQVPVTYRDAPLPGAESFLVGTPDHSVLGTRWVYDACRDPVYVRALATAILIGGRQADIELVTDAGTQLREATTHVSGSGSPGTAVPPLGTVAAATEGTTTVIKTDHFTLFVARSIQPDETMPPESHQVLMGDWPGRPTPALLAHLELT